MPKKHRRLKPFPLFVFTLMVIAITALSASHIRGNISYYEDELLKKKMEQIELEARISSLEREISMADDDSYIIDVARTRYGYLMPGEVCFKVTNISSVMDNPEVEIVEVGE